MLNCLLFSCLVPIISLIAAIFFYIKYLIDKYNLIFVYFKIYESGGKIRKHVTRYLFFNLGMFLVIHVAYFSIYFLQKEFLYLGVIFIVFWAVFAMIKNYQLQKMIDNQTISKMNEATSKFIPENTE